MAENTGNYSVLTSQEVFFAWLGAFIGYLFDYYEISLTSIIIVPIKRLYHLSAPEAALAPGLVLLFVAIGGIIFGHLGDRMGRKKILYITIATYSVATLLRAATFNYVYFLVLTAIAGLGLGGEFGVGQSLITEVAPPARRGWWSGAFYGSGGFGIILSALVGIALLPVIGFRWVFVISGLLGFLSFAVRRKMPESGIWEKKLEEAKKGEVKKRPSVWTPTFLVPFFKCLALGTIQFFMYYLVNSSLPLYLTSRGLTITHASWFVFLIGSGVTVGSFVGAYLSDIIGRRAIGSAGAILVVTAATFLYFMGHNFLTSPYVVVPFFFLGWGFATPAQVLGVFFSEQFPTLLRSTGTSATNQIARGLSFFPPLVAVYIYTTTNSYSDVFLVAIILALIEAAYFWAFKETKKKDINF